mgnify:FL=1|jgi:hypothetical protein
MTHKLQTFAGYPCLIFPASQSLETHTDELTEKLSSFLQRWESHGSPVQGGFAILENRFVVVAHRPLEISGCSRDDLLFFMRDIGQSIGVEWLGAVRVFYRDSDGKIQNVDRLKFKQLAKEGSITGDTLVFDTTIRETNAVLEGRFALPASQSWHARLMETATAA